MSIVFQDSFDGYTTAQLSQKWQGGATNGNVQISPGGRNGTNCMDIYDHGQLWLLPPPSVGFISGFAFNTNCPPASIASGNGVLIFTYANHLGTLASLYINNVGGFTIVLGNGTTTASSPSSLWVVDVYGQLQFGVFTSAVGPTVSVSCTLYWNNVSVISLFTGNQTLGTDNVEAVGVTWFNPSYVIAVDDFYLVNTQDGIVPTTYPGDLRSTAVFPNGVGAHSGWTPDPMHPGSANWTLVDEAPPDGDSSYVYTSTPGTIDSYQYPAATGLVPGGTIYAVQNNIFVRKDNAGSRAVTPLAHISGTDYPYNSSGVSIGDSYVYYYASMPVNPNTTVAWAAADIGGSTGAQFGIKDVV